MSIDFEALVFTAIADHTRDQPQDLVGILGSVDGREKMLLTFDELNIALGELVRIGKIGEVSRHQFYARIDSDDPPASTSPFSGLSLEDYDTACEQYHREFQRKLRELK